MVKQWVQPPINKNRLPPGVFFLLGSHLPSFIIVIFIIHYLLEYCGRPNTKKTPNNKNRSPC